MPNFKDRRLQIAAAMQEQSGLRLRLCVAGQQHRNAAEGHAQRNRIIVDVRRRPSNERQFGCEHLDVRRRPKVERRATLCADPLDVSLTHDLERAVIRRPRIQLR